LSEQTGTWETKASVRGAVRTASRIVGRGKWDPDLHPRDRKGRFIETGARVKVPGGRTGTVVRNTGHGYMEVRLDDGKVHRIHRNYLEVQRRPDGTRPHGQAAVRNRSAQPKPMPVEAPSPDATEYRPKGRDSRVPVGELTQGQPVLIFGRNRNGDRVARVGLVSSVRQRNNGDYVVDLGDVGEVYTDEDGVARPLDSDRLRRLIDATRSGDDAEAQRIAQEIQAEILAEDDDEFDRLDTPGTGAAGGRQAGDTPRQQERPQTARPGDLSPGDRVEFQVRVNEGNAARFAGEGAVNPPRPGQTVTVRGVVDHVQDDMLGMQAVRLRGGAQWQSAGGGGPLDEGALDWPLDTDHEVTKLGRAEPRRRRGGGGDAAAAAPATQGALFYDRGEDESGTPDMFTALEREEQAQAPAAPSGRGDERTPSAPEAPATPARGGEVTVDEAMDAVRRAYFEMRPQPRPAGDYAPVSLVELRNRLSDIPRETLDQALARLNLEPDIFLWPESNQKILTREDRAAAIRLGNQDLHWIQMEASARRADTPAPGRGDERTPSAPEAPATPAADTPDARRTSPDTPDTQRVPDAGDDMDPQPGILSDEDTARLREALDAYRAALAGDDPAAVADTRDAVRNLTLDISRRAPAGDQGRRVREETDRINEAARGRFLEWDEAHSGALNAHLSQRAERAAAAAGLSEDARRAAENGDMDRARQLIEQGRRAYPDLLDWDSVERDARSRYVDLDEIESTDDGNPPSPPGMTAARRAELVAAIEREAGGYEFTGEPGRYVAEMMDANREEWDWINAYIQAHPEVLTWNPAERDRRRRARELREQRTRELLNQAFERFQAGEIDEAERMVDEAERRAPGIVPYDQIRAQIAARRAELGAPETRTPDTPDAPETRTPDTPDAPETRTPDTPDAPEAGRDVLDQERAEREPGRVDENEALARRLLPQVEQLIDRGDFDAARALLDEVDRMAPGLDEIEELSNRIVQRREEAERERGIIARLPDPEVATSQQIRDGFDLIGMSNTGVAAERLHSVLDQMPDFRRVGRLEQERIRDQFGEVFNLLRQEIESVDGREQRRWALRALNRLEELAGIKGVNHVGQYESDFRNYLRERSDDELIEQIRSMMEGHPDFPMVKLELARRGYNEVGEPAAGSRHGLNNPVEATPDMNGARVRAVIDGGEILEGTLEVTRGESGPAYYMLRDRDNHPRLLGNSDDDRVWVERLDTAQTGGETPTPDTADTAADAPGPRATQRRDRADGDSTERRVAADEIRPGDRITFYRREGGVRGGPTARRMVYRESIRWTGTVPDDYRPGRPVRLVDVVEVEEGHPPRAVLDPPAIRLPDRVDRLGDDEARRSAEEGRRMREEAIRNREELRAAMEAQRRALLVEVGGEGLAQAADRFQANREVPLQDPRDLEADWYAVDSMLADALAGDLERERRYQLENLRTEYATSLFYAGGDHRRALRDGEVGRRVAADLAGPRMDEVLGSASDADLAAAIRYAERQARRAEADGDHDEARTWREAAEQARQTIADRSFRHLAEQPEPQATREPGSVREPDQVSTPVASPEQREAALSAVEGAAGLAAHGPERLPDPEPGVDNDPVISQLPDTYDIAEHLLPRAIAKLEAANRRAERLGIPERFTWEITRYEAEWEEDDDESGVRRHFTQPRVRLRLNRPVVRRNGWTFVGTLTWSNDAGLVTRLVPGESLKRRPDRRWCDHCQTERDRRDTFIVRHEDGTELQVGSDCLEAFTGVSPSGLWMLGFSPNLTDDNLLSAGEDALGDSTRQTVRAADVLAVATAVVNRHGWVSRAAAEERGGRSTAELIRQALFPGGHGEPEEVKKWRSEIHELAARMRDDVAEIQAFAANYPGDDEFSTNLRTLAQSEWIDRRNIGVLAYAVAAKMRHDEEVARAAAVPGESPYVGRPGERIRDVEARIVGKQYISGREWGSSELVTLVTPKGQVIKWFKSGGLGSEFRIGDTVLLSGTVDKHSEFRGVPETMVKRAKLTRVSRVGRPGDLDRPEPTPPGWLAVGDRLEHRSGRFGTIEDINRRHGADADRVIYDITLRDDDTGELVTISVSSQDSAYRVAQAPHTPLEHAEEVGSGLIGEGDRLWVNVDGKGRAEVTVQRFLKDKELELGTTPDDESVRPGLRRRYRDDIYDDNGDPILPRRLTQYRVAEVKDDQGRTYLVGLPGHERVVRVLPPPPPPKRTTPRDVEEAARERAERRVRDFAPAPLKSGYMGDFYASSFAVGDTIRHKVQRDDGSVHAETVTGTIVEIRGNEMTLRDADGRLHRAWVHTVKGDDVISLTDRPPVEEVTPGKVRDGDRLWVNIGGGMVKATVTGKRRPERNERLRDQQLNEVSAAPSDTVIQVRTDDGETGEFLVQRGIPVYRVIDPDRIAAAWNAQPVDLDMLAARAEALEAFRRERGLTPEALERVEQAALDEALRRVEQYGDIARVTVSSEPLGFQIVPHRKPSRVPRGLDTKIPLLRPDGRTWDGEELPSSTPAAAAPDAPGTPDVPRAPEVPGTPEAAGTLEAPRAPEVPGTPEAPATPEAAGAALPARPAGPDPAAKPYTFRRNPAGGYNVHTDGQDRPIGRVWRDGAYWYWEHGDGTTSTGERTRDRAAAALRNYHDSLDAEHGTPEQVPAATLAEGDRIDTPNGVEVVQSVQTVEGVTFTTSRDEHDRVTIRAHTEGAAVTRRRGGAKPAQVSEPYARDVQPGQWLIVDGRPMQVTAVDDVDDRRVFHVAGEGGATTVEFGRDTRVTVATNLRPRRTRRRAAPPPTEVEGVRLEPIPEGTASARVRLRSDIRKRVLGLGIERDETASEQARQAAARLRASQPMTAEQMQALAAHLRGMAGDEGRPAVQRRALHRASQWVEAAYAGLAGYPAPPHDPGRDTLQRVSAGNLTSGDVIALPDRDGRVEFVRVVETRQYRGFPLVSARIERNDGTREERILSARADVWLAPDLPEDQEVRPADAGELVSEHIPLSRLEVGDAVEYPVRDGDVVHRYGRVAEITRLSGPWDPEDTYLVRLEVVDGETGFPVASDAVTMTSRGWPSIIRTERGELSRNQPWDAVLDDSGGDGPIEHGQIGRGDRITVTPVAGEPVAGTVENVTPVMEGDRRVGSLVTIRTYNDTVQAVPILDGDDTAITRQARADDNVRASIDRQMRRRALEERRRRVAAAIADAESRLYRDASARIMAELSTRPVYGPGEAPRGGDDEGMRVWATAPDMVEQAWRDLDPGPVAEQIADAFGVTGQQREALIERVRPLVAQVQERAMDNMVASIMDVEPLPGETYDRALRRMIEQLQNDPPINFAVIGRDLGAYDLDPVEAAGDLPDIPRPEGGSIADRIAAYRRALPEDLANFGHKQVNRPVFRELDLDQLSERYAPEMDTITAWVPDTAPDGGPGEHAMRHLAIVKAAGAEIDTEFTRRLETDEAYRKAADELEKARDAVRQAEQTYVNRRSTGRWADRRRIREARQREEQAKQTLIAARRRVFVEMMSEVRSLGGVELDYRRSDGTPIGDDARPMMDEVHRLYPSDWLAALAERGPITIRFGERGAYDPDSHSIVFASPDEHEHRRTMAHELAHAMEHTIPGLREAQEAYLWERTARGEIGERERPDMAPIDGNPDQVGYPDAFPQEYSGRVYPSGNREVLATAMEDLMTGGDYLDDDYRRWLLGTLALIGTDRNGPARDPLAGVNLNSLSVADLQDLLSNLEYGSAAWQKVMAELRQRDHDNDPLAGVDLDRLSLEELADLMGEVDDPYSLARINEALDRRERLDREEEERYARAEQLVAAGTHTWAEAWAEVYGLSAEQVEREERLAQLGMLGGRRPGETLDQYVTRQYDEWLEARWLAAEAATNGYMLNREGRARGIDPRTLFYGSWDRVKKYGSQELLNWFEANGWMNKTEFRAQMLQRERDVRAAKRSKEARR